MSRRTTAAVLVALLVMAFTESMWRAYAAAFAARFLAGALERWLTGEVTP